ncbi:MAG: SIS domain-containing protein [Phycisphaerales bacterium]|nr:SIS domain-containing protein [Phycisphaerales bacterium]
MTLETDLLSSRIDASLETTSRVRDCLPQIESATHHMIEALQRGGTVWTAGNGGSAAQAMHISEELVGRYRRTRRGLSAASLVADPTALTCIANDFGFEHVFSRQVEGLARSGDLLLVLSTSGNSDNIVNALQVARQQGVSTIGLLGGDGGQCKPLCDVSICIPNNDSALIQDAHQLVLHLICEAIDAWAEETDKRHE